jgi:flagellar motility protein MotE (MotC chaperone)
MKSTVSLVRAIVLSVVVMMLFHVNDIVQEMRGSHIFRGFVERVLAQAGATEAVAVKDEARSLSDHEANLMKSLHERQQQLDNREKALKDEEKKIETLKREVTEKIEALRALEEKMSPPLDVQKEETDKKYKVLAKMYEATPPEKAAMIFEKMERKMAAEIMLRMNSKKAGAIWAHINRDIGLGIVREITSSQSVDAASATRIAKEISGEELIKPKTPQRVSEENIVGADKEGTRAEVTKPETLRSKEKEVPQIKPKKNAGLKEEKVKKVRSERHKPFAIQIKAVRDLEMAKEYTKMLKDEGIDAYWSEMNLKGKGTLYRILVGHFAIREDALKYMKKNNIDGNYPGSFIYKSEQAFPKKKKQK